MAEPRGRFTDPGEVLLVEVDAVDQHAPEDGACASLVDGDETALNHTQLAARIAAMAIRIGVLKVPQEQVDEWHDLEQTLRRSVPASLDTGAQTALAGGLQEVAGERGLRQGLSARQRHAPAGVLIEDAVLIHFRDNLMDGHDAARGLEGSRGAGLDAAEARRAQRPAQGVRAVNERVRASGTHLAARAAADAKRGCEEQLRLEALRLRVVAPATVERAALKEHRCPDPGPVVDAETLDVENDALGHDTYRAIHPAPRECHRTGRCAKRARLPL